VNVVVDLPVDLEGRPRDLSSKTVVAIRNTAHIPPVHWGPRSVFLEHDRRY
jgi:hypothetical protein